MKLRLMPLLTFCYLLQFLDKQSLSYATLLGLIEDTNLQGNEYSWVASVFYFGYLLWEGPTSYLMVRFPLGKYLSWSVLIWGTVLMFHGACNSFTGLMITRFFLGVAEASVAPGFSLMMGIFYKRSEQPFRHGLWFCGNSLAHFVGSILGFIIGNTNAGIAPWRLLFIIFGAITVFWAVIMLLLLPDSPSDAKFLSARDKQVAIARVAENNTGIRSHQFKPEQVMEALRDPNVWLLTLYNFCINLPNGGLTSFGSLVIKGFGYGRLRSLLLQMPSGFIQLGIVILVTILPSKIRNIRTLLMFVAVMISNLGIAIVYFVDPAYKHVRLAGYYLCVSYGAQFPLGLSLVSSNVGGFTKKATVTGLMFVSYCVGNIVGPQFYFPSEAPRYTTGIASALTGFSVSCLLLIVLRIHLIRENKRRDRAINADTVDVEVEEGLDSRISDLTDWQRPSFRYVY
ncbi:MFS general substrate transporter [Rhizodiscina lignyota]|uniref:MFS general substrate transporter n=1 Tax=Rhizodiscina lignyota TaxID=1504668 RepID=A0A9P4I3G4_9PEZI|nr:MFS general substrate transporter [Rhizodiscina lignyota]